MLTKLGTKKGVILDPVFGLTKNNGILYLANNKKMEYRVRQKIFTKLSIAIVKTEEIYEWL